MLSTTTLTAVFGTLLSLASAAPSSLTPRQGGSFYAVGQLYSGGGCTNLIFADPIFTSNACTPLDRNNNVPDITSYRTSSVAAGCSVKLYASTDCSGTSFAAPVGACTQAGTPFQSAFVTCV